MEPLSPALAPIFRMRMSERVSGFPWEGPASNWVPKFKVPDLLWITGRNLSS